MENVDLLIFPRLFKNFKKEIKTADLLILRLFFIKATFLKNNPCYDFFSNPLLLKKEISLFHFIETRFMKF